MKAYGLRNKRDLGWYEVGKQGQIYYDGYSVRKCDIEIRRVLKRRERRYAQDEINEQLEEHEVVKCSCCDDMAVYCTCLKVGELTYRCEFHVPRGCSCTEDDKDPCVDWIYSESGFLNE